MNIDQQIEKLNNEVKVYLAPSTIHGIGVFALYDIKKGEKMYCEPSFTRPWYIIPSRRFGELKKEVGGVIKQRWACIVNSCPFRSPNDDASPVLFMNHSKNPNYDCKSDCALMDIRKGEEIVEDYTLMENYCSAFEFLCK